MKSNSFKQKFLRAVIGGAMVAGLLPANAFAVAAFPTTGSCAMLITQPVPYGATVPFTSTYNIIAVFTFTGTTTGTADYNGVRATYGVGGFTIAPKVAGDNGLAIPVTIAPITGFPSARTLTFTPTGSPTPVTASAISVNGGSTLLIQGSSEPFSGVCQF